MKISAKGMIDLAYKEGICLDPYLDSVNVWTIGIGRTAYDGKDPRSFGKITVEKAIELFKEDIKPYENEVRKAAIKSSLSLNQSQIDALCSACYNFGAGNLRKLMTNRNEKQIGEALMLYRRPPEIIPRRQAEQRLYQTGKYQCEDGRVPVFPVSSNHRPIYSKSKLIDIRPYFEEL